MGLRPRAGESANVLAAPAPAPDFFVQVVPDPDFFPKRLRLLFFFQTVPAPRSLAPAPDYWLSLAKYAFPRQLVR